MNAYGQGSNRLVAVQKATDLGSRLRAEDVDLWDQFKQEICMMRATKLDRFIPPKNNLSYKQIYRSCFFIIIKLSLKIRPARRQGRVRTSRWSRGQRRPFRPPRNLLPALQKNCCLGWLSL